MKITIELKNKEIDRINSMLVRMNDQYGEPDDCPKYDKETEISKRFGFGTFKKEGAKMEIDMNMKFVNHLCVLFESGFQAAYRFVKSRFMKSVMKLDEFFIDLDKKEEEAKNPPRPSDDIFLDGAFFSSKDWIVERDQSTGEVTSVTRIRG